MTEHPFTPKPGPTPGSVSTAGSGPAPAPGTSLGAGRPAAPQYSRQGDGPVPRPSAPAPQPGEPGPRSGEPGPRSGEPGPQLGEPGPQPGAASEPDPQPGATPEPGDGSRGPARTSPVQQVGPASRNRTGDAVVDRALDELDTLPGQPLDRHIEVGQRVHRTLQARLADIGRE